MSPLIPHYYSVRWMVQYLSRFYYLVQAYRFIFLTYYRQFVTESGTRSFHLWNISFEEYSREAVMQWWPSEGLWKPWPQHHLLDYLRVSQKVTKTQRDRKWTTLDKHLRWSAGSCQSFRFYFSLVALEHITCLNVKLYKECCLMISVRLYTNLDLGIKKKS